MPHSSRLLAGAVLCAAWLLAAAVPADAQEDRFNVNTCQTPERDDRGCGQVRWGWGSCPGNVKEACDWCYGPDGGVFAYVKRTNKTYKLASKCEQLAQLPPEDVFWSVTDPEVVDRMESAGGTCVPDRGVYICQRVDPQVYRQQTRRPARDVSTPVRNPDTGDLEPGTPCVPKRNAPALSTGYDAIPIRRLDILEGEKFRANPGSFAKKYEALANGTFFAAPKPGAPIGPVGPVVVNGVSRSQGFTQAGRGAIVVSKGQGGDDVVRVVRQPAGRTPEEIRGAFPNMRDFMGGGALLIEDGRAVSTDDLLTRQQFRNPSRTGDKPAGTNQGLHAAQMNSAYHTLIGVRNGTAYLLINKTKKTGSQIQRDLCEQGFDDVVMFDGGRAFVYYRNGEEQPGTYKNLPGLTGLGVNPK
jgi:Phosphodiester glycosidase